VRHPPLKPTVVLLHGLARSARSLAGLRRWLGAHGHPTWSYTYPSRRVSIAELARTVQAAMDAELGARRRLVVTHSLGGILVRHMDSGARLQRAVMLAPPNHGSRVARAFVGHPLFRWLYGPAGQDVVQPDGWPPPPCPFAVIAGTGGTTLGNPISWVTRAAGLIPPGEPSDGTLTVAETRHPGMAAFAEVPASHTWIMDHPAARDLVLRFLDHGRF
jgi:hypothetical protein